MTKKVFIYSFLVGALALILCAGLTFALQYRDNIDEAYSSLEKQTDYVERGVSLNGIEFLRQLPEDRRVTWIAADGSVLFDSQNENLSNQAELSEVRDAMKTGSGQASRTSGSNGVSTMYYARKMEDGTIIRMSIPVSAVQAALSSVSPLIWVFILVLTTSGILAFRAARQIVRPINELDLDHPEQMRTYAELSPLVDRLKEQRLTIDDQIEELHRRQKELSAITDNMREGFLLLDREGMVLSANTTAQRLVAQAVPGEALLQTVDDRTRRAAEQALKGERAEISFTVRDQSWQMIASPVLSHKKIVGAVLLWMDVTEREQRERLRQEFSANVSHELKTPLTSISGFAELMAGGAVPMEKVVEFSADIHREAQRMIALVNDIIKLSKLDENASLPAEEAVDLYELAGSTLDDISAVAEKQNVTLHLEGEHVTVHGVWQLLSEMVYNLCDNAIKYNRPDGSLTVTVGHQEGCPMLSVSDTGIGIPDADQSRVFERFYRVDKSHSKKIGGTGLGLSIVKHGAQYHNARVELQSTLGVGTTVTLLFPKPENQD